MTEDGSPPKPKASVPPPPPSPSRPPPSVPPPSVPPPGASSPPSQPPPPPFRPATQPFSPEMIVHESGAPPPQEQAQPAVGVKTILGQPVPPAVAASTSSAPMASAPPAMATESQPVQLPQTPAAAALTEALGNFDGDAFKSTARAFFDFNLDKIVTRSLAKVLYALSWIEAAAVLLMGWYNAVMAVVNGAVGVGLAMLILAPLGAIGVLILARIICELLILAVSSHEALQEMRAALKE